MRLFGKKWIGRRVVVTACVVAAALVAPAAPASAGPSQPCSSVYIVGVRGSGQNFDGMGSDALGPQVAAVQQSLVFGLRERTTATQALYYTAASTDLLTRTTYLLPWRWREFFASVHDGVGALHTTLDLRADSCPQEGIVLIGYSQGALAIRKTLARLAAGDAADRAVLNRVAAVGLIADPSKSRREPNVGTAHGSSTGAATLFRLSDAPVPIPRQVMGRVHHLCNHEDLVCDTNHVWSLDRAKRVHRGYTDPTGSPYLLAQALVNPTMSRSRPWR
jgi:hypothetical protein